MNGLNTANLQFGAREGEPSPPTAHLQQRVTVRAAALLMNVSERSVYMARELQATGRNDICAEVDAGRLTIAGALKLAKPEKYAKPADGYQRLVAAWHGATAADRQKFVELVARTRS